MLKSLRKTAVDADWVELKTRITKFFGAGWKASGTRWLRITWREVHCKREFLGSELRHGLWARLSLPF